MPSNKGKSGNSASGATNNNNNINKNGGATNSNPHRSNYDNGRNKRQSQKEKIEMAKKIRRQTNSMNFKIRFGLSLIGLGVCIYFLLTAIAHGYGSEVLSFIKHIKNVPPAVVVFFDIVYCISFFLLSWYILTNRRGHYTFWAFRISIALCVFCAFGWLVIFLINSREPNSNVPWHLLGLPLTFLAINFLVFLVDKELRRAMCGEYEFRQIIRERGLDN